MLRHVLRATAEAPVLVVATYRDTDLDREHPLGSMLADLGRLADGQRIALTGLDEQGVDELFEQATNRPLDIEARELSRALHLETRGNAFFLTEVLQHLLETGALAQDGSIAESTEVASRGIPQGVKALLGERLTRLGDTASLVLRAAAVVGRAFDVRLAAAASALAEDVVVDALDRALVARLVEDSGRGSYCFSHALVRSALLDELSTARRIRLHAAGGVRARGRSPRRRRGAGISLVRGGRRGQSAPRVEVSREAAQRGGTQSAFDEAVQILERAIDLVSETGSEAMLLPALLLDLGDARMGAGSIERAPN